MSKKRPASGKQSAVASQSEAPNPKRRRVEAQNQVSRPPNVNSTDPVERQNTARLQVEHYDADVSAGSKSSLGAINRAQGNIKPGSESRPVIPPVQSLSTSKRKKKKRTREKQSVNGAALNEEDQLVQDGQALSKAPRSRDHKISKLSTQDRTEQQLIIPHPKSKKGWTLAITSGGRYLQKDPVFTPEGEHVILADKFAVHVYSKKTSLLLRSFNPPGDDVITSYDLSYSDDRYLWVVTKSGRINKWRWSTGEHTTSWEGNRKIKLLYSIGGTNSEDFERVMTCSSLHGSEQTEIEILYLSKHDRHIEKSFSILQATNHVLGFWVSNEDNTIVAFAESKLYFGTADMQNRSSEKEESWVWRELSLTKELVSFDVRKRANSESKGHARNVFDIVIGCRNGEIVIYDDLLGTLEDAEKSSSKHYNQATPRILHWHRNAVESVKWSRDGNYLVSGGHETVLVIWQLDTGHRQYLPHLSSPVESIVVSPSGSSYAVRLANNSVIILATSTLDPTATFSGLGLRCLSNGKQLSEKDPFPMTMDALDSRCLFAAVSASQSTKATSFLQAFDVAASQHISRQALARNSTTNFNTTPSGQNVPDPIVKQLKTTPDGQWLVSVEQWAPSEEDINVLYPTDSEYALQRSRAKEVKLRFWKRDRSNKTWDMNTRIDGPHTTENGAASSVLGVAASSHGAEVATVGEDASIRIWRPKVRTRNGHAVKNLTREPLQTWTCRSSTELAHVSLDTLSETTPAASLAYSEDGSVIAAYFREDGESDAPPPPIYFLDSQSGNIRHQTPHLVTGQTVRLGFLDQFLIVLSDHLRVWDTVNSRLIFGMPIQKSPDMPAFKLLSTQHADRTFAVSFPLTRSKKPGLRSQIAVFKPDQSEPLFQKDVSMLVTGLLALPTSGGYVITDENAGVYLMRPPDAPALTGSITPSAEVDKGLERLFGPRQVLAVENMPQGDVDKIERPARHVGRHLGGLLEGPISSSALLSVKDLFEKVSLAYSGRRVPVA